MDTKNSGEKKPNLHIMEQLNGLNNNLYNIRNKCEELRYKLDSAYNKLDSVSNLIQGMRNKEQEIVTAGGEEAVVNKMNEEQIDSILEMMKTPAFHNIARQVLLNLASKEENK